jgi:hypothetical protein
MVSGRTVGAPLGHWGRLAPRRAPAYRSFDCSCGMSTRQSARQPGPRLSRWAKRTTCRHRLSTVGQSADSHPRHGRPLHTGSTLTRRMRTSASCSTKTWKRDAFLRASRRRRSYRCSAHRTPTTAGAFCPVRRKRRHVVAGDPPRSGAASPGRLPPPRMTCPRTPGDLRQALHGPHRVPLQGGPQPRGLA